ncbi:MAG: GNAT family N-acetyltransferase [Planctomycetota bacterium]|jgi:ribosomal protein S18 acetylase RimI-like enzyme
MSTLLREALDSDIDVLIDLSRRTISASYRSFLGDEAVDAFLGSGEVDRYVRESLDRCSVIVRDGQIVGYAVCRDNLIDLMMVDHACHRQGLGTELLHHVEAGLHRKFEELRLESFEANTPANAFYRKHGWREVSKHFDDDAGVNKIVFKKPTRPPAKLCDA